MAKNDQIEVVGHKFLNELYMLSELKSYRPKLVAPIYPAVQLVHASKHYPCHSGEKRLLTTTSTSRACLHWAGYDGFDQELQSGLDGKVKLDHF